MRARKSDSNQQQIVDALRRCGAFVFDLHGVGRGCPDLLVWKNRWLLIECKGKRGILTQEQIIFQRECKGNVIIVRSAMEAVEVMNEG